MRTILYLRDVTTWLLLLLHDDVLFFIYVLCLCSEFSILDRSSYPKVKKKNNNNAIYIKEKNTNRIRLLYKHHIIIIHNTVSITMKTPTNQKIQKILDYHADERSSQTIQKKKVKEG